MRLKSKKPRSLAYPVCILHLHKILSQNFDNMLYNQSALTGVILHLSHWFRTTKSKNEPSWIFHLRWYTHSCIKRIYINYRCKWCYVHFNQTHTLALTLVSLSVNRFGRQFQPTFWRFSLVFYFYLYVYNCLCSCECLSVCACVFFVSFNM